MTRNNDDQQKVNELNALLEAKNKKAKPSWLGKLLHFGHMVEEVQQFVYEDDNKAAEKIRKDILRIESEREKERIKLEEERKKLELAAKEQAKLKKPGYLQRWFKKEKAIPAAAPVAAQPISQIPVETPRQVAPTTPTPAPQAVNQAVVNRPTPVATVSIPTPTPQSVAPSVVQASVVEELEKELAAARQAKQAMEQVIRAEKEAQSANGGPEPVVLEEKVVKDFAEIAGEAVEKAISDENQAKMAAAAKPGLGFAFGGSQKVDETSQVKPADFNPANLFDKKSRNAKKFADELKKQEQVLMKSDVENRYWQPYNMVRANLIKEQRSLFFNWNKKILTLVFTSSIAILTVLLIYFGLVLWQMDKIKSNSGVFENLKSLNTSITSEEAKATEIIDFNNRLIYVAYLLDNHVYWTQFFKMLEDRTTTAVYYEGFSGDLSGSYKIPGVCLGYNDQYPLIKSLMANDKGIEDGFVLRAETSGAKMVEASDLATPGQSDTGTNGSNNTNNNQQTNTNNSGTGPSTPTVAPGPRPGDIRFVLDITVNPRSIFLK